MTTTNPLGFRVRCRACEHERLVSMQEVQEKGLPNDLATWERRASCSKCGEREKVLVWVEWPRPTMGSGD